MRIKILITALAVLTLACSAFADTAYPLREKFPNATPISTEDLFKRIDDGKTLIVDVRSEFEFETISINGAINIPISNVTYKETMAAKMPKDQDVAVVYYCNGVL